MSRSRLVAVLLLLLASAPILAAPAPAAAVDAPCAAGLGVGLVEFPRDSKDPRAQTYVIDHVAPGAQFARRFQVCNGTAATVTVQLYAGAAEVSGGEFRIIEGRSTNELATWIRIEPATATLAPGQRLLARASFAVPSNASAGERYAVLLAELPAQPRSDGVSVASRVGVRVYLDVGPGGAPVSDFVVDSLQAGRDASGRGQVTARVRNTGMRALDVTGSLTLRDGPGGLSGGPYPARLGTTLAPGDDEPVLVPIDTAIADGPWTARLSLRSGLLERRVEAALTFPAAAGEVGPPVDVEQLPVAGNEVVQPRRVLLALLIPALAAVGLAAWQVRRRRTVATDDGQ